jgi:hypothetical protein
MDGRESGIRTAGNHVAKNPRKLLSIGNDGHPINSINQELKKSKSNDVGEAGGVVKKRQCGEARESG